MRLTFRNNEKKSFIDYFSDFTFKTITKSSFFNRYYIDVNRKRYIFIFIFI